MKLLLDTHIWLWSLLEPKRLARPVAKALQKSKTELWLSPVTLWETIALVEQGRVLLDKDVEAWISDALAVADFKEAPITHAVALETHRAWLCHEDPADRFLAATARVFDLTLVTADARLLALPHVTTLANTASA